LAIITVLTLPNLEIFTFTTLTLLEIYRTGEERKEKSRCRRKSGLRFKPEDKEC